MVDLFKERRDAEVNGRRVKQRFENRALFPPVCFCFVCGEEGLELKAAEIGVVELRSWLVLMTAEN